MENNFDRSYFFSGLRQRWWTSRPMSNRLTVLAFVLWVFSLILPGLVVPSHVSDLENIYGINLLLLGWIGPLAGIFSWYANPFFLYVCRKLLSKSSGTPTTAAALSVLLASTMFFYERIPLGGGGSPVSIYGYGWGAFLWYSAILLAAAALGVRRLEQGNQNQAFRSIWRNGSVILLILWLVVSLSIGTVQKFRASSTERHRLYQVVFSRGVICATPDAKVLATIPFSGALQVTDDSSSSVFLGLTSPANLISWGIPVVRKGKFDYYRSDSSPDWHLVAGPPTGPVGAKLLAGSDFNGRYVVRAHLTSADTKVVALSARWVSGRDSNPHYCPGYFPAAKESEPPRNLLLSALVRPEGAFTPPPQQKLIFEGGFSKDVVVNRVLLIGKIGRSAFYGNMGCPDDVGLRHLWYRNVNPSERVFSPPPSWGLTGPQPVNVLKKELDGQGQLAFQEHDSFHLIKSIKRFESVCDGQSIYIGYGLAAGNDYLYLQKRTLPGFKKAWLTDKQIIFQRSGEAAAAVYRGFHIYSVSEIENGLRIVLAYFNKDNEEGALVQVETSAPSASSRASIQK